MLIICIALIVVTEFVLRRTVYGRTLSAVGQSRAAARLAGVRRRSRDHDRVCDLSNAGVGISGWFSAPTWAALSSKWASPIFFSRSLP